MIYNGRPVRIMDLFKLRFRGFSMCTDIRHCVIQGTVLFLAVVHFMLGSGGGRLGGQARTDVPQENSTTAPCPSCEAFLHFVVHAQ